MKRNTQIILIVVLIVGSSLGTLVVPAGLILWKLGSLYQEEVNKDDLLKSGKRGKAKILKVSEDNESKYRYMAVLVLEVSVPNYPTYQTRKSERIPPIHAPRVQPGLTIDVLVDPEQPQNEKRILLLLE